MIRQKYISRMAGWPGQNIYLTRKDKKEKRVSHINQKSWKNGSYIMRILMWVGWKYREVGVGREGCTKVHRYLFCLSICRIAWVDVLVVQYVCELHSTHSLISYILMIISVEIRYYSFVLWSIATLHQYVCVDMNNFFLGTDRIQHISLYS